MKLIIIIFFLVLLISCNETIPVDLVEAQKETEAIIELHRNGLNDKALIRGKEFLIQYPNAPGINYALAMIQGNKNNHPLAEQYYRNELSLKKPYKDALRGLAISLVEQGKDIEAIKVLQEHLIKEVIDDPQASLMLANLQGDQGRNDLAQNRYREAIKGNAIGARGDYGKWLVQQQLYNEAVPFLLQALQEDSDNASARTNLASALQSLGEDKLAAQIRESHLERSLIKDEMNHITSSSRLAGANAENFYNLGVIRARSGKLSKAVKAYSRALELSEGKHARAALGLAGLYQFNQQYDEARKWVVHALILNPEDSKTNFMMGNLRIISGDLEYARQSFEKVKDSGNWSSNEQLLGAITARDSLQLEFGLELLKILPNSDEELPRLLSVRAQFLILMNRNEQARDDINTALKLDPNCNMCLLTGYVIGSLEPNKLKDLPEWTEKLVNQSLLKIILGAKIDSIGKNLIKIKAFREPIIELRKLVLAQYQEKLNGS